MAIATQNTLANNQKYDFCDVLTILIEKEKIRLTKSFNKIHADGDPFEIDTPFFFREILNDVSGLYFIAKQEGCTISKDK